MIANDNVIRYRRHLVEMLKQEGYLSSTRLEQAFLAIPRHAFLDHLYLRDATSKALKNRLVQAPPANDEAAWQAWLRTIYANEALITAVDSVGLPTSSSSAPNIMAAMLEALNVQPGQRVLEIGTGTGYNAALLAWLVGNPHLVFSIEIAPELAQAAQRKLDEVIGPGIIVYAGNGLHGYPPGAPYDRIIATGSCGTVPLPWLEQLRDGGLLVMNLRGRVNAGSMVRLEKIGDRPSLAAQGKFLSVSSFMVLHDGDQNECASPGKLLATYRNLPVQTSFSVSSQEFDPTFLWDSHFGFLLDMVLPHACFAGMNDERTQTFIPCLIDEASKTMLAFRSTEQKDSRLLDVRGDPGVWERLLETYRWWLESGRPSISDYTLKIDAEGTARISLRTKQASAIWPGL